MDVIVQPLGMGGGGAERGGGGAGVCEVCLGGGASVWGRRGHVCVREREGESDRDGEEGGGGAGQRGWSGLGELSLTFKWE